MVSSRKACILALKAARQLARSAVGLLQPTAFELDRQLLGNEIKSTAVNVRSVDLRTP